MAHNFITNKEAQKTLKGRLNHIIPVSEELKFLVGFFYFSGWKEVYERIKENPSLKIKLLIGLQVDKVLNSVVEHGKQEESLSQEDIFQQFLMSMGKAINNEELDNEAFYNQVSFFLELLEKGNLQIRKTLDPNHAKLYLFKYNEQEKLKNDSPGEIITGSSNLTKAGLGGQSEFNVEIRDYGFEEAEAFFDDLWDSAVPISEVDERKRLLVNFIRYKSQAASVSPFEAYVLILKTYLDLQAQNQVKPDIENLLEDNGFEKYSYQLDAVNQALSIIKEYNGAIIADVVGLGKSVIAALIAKSLGKRGIVICPPGLMGDRNENTGWHEYLNRFGLWNWEVHSRGKLEDLATSLKKDNRGIEMVIVDEAHYFKNQDTEAYEQLLNVCRGKTVLLLTATPFSNTPADIFSLLKLFIIPGRSGITIEDNMEATFRAYEYRFKNLSYITKNYKSTDPKKRKKAESYYVKFFGLQLPVDITLVKNETRELADNIKSIIAPVVIRRNRIDLKTDHQYSKEIKALSEVDDPKELFFSLSEKQSEFYDKVINSYFGENGVFTGAIYQPFVYEKVIEDEENLDEAGNRAFQQQRNLFDFMRRLLVKRFESSFGAFYESIKRFERIHRVVQEFIRKTKGKYILDRHLIEAIYKDSEEEIEQALQEFEESLANKQTGKNNRIYQVNKFERKEEFHEHVENDRQLFDKILDEIEKLHLVENDPKRANVIEAIEEVLQKEKQQRKVIVFSEYVDTVEHLEPYFKKELGERVLVCNGTVNKTMAQALYANFDAQYNGKQENKYDVLVTSDKLSEGFNLNRAGLIINYDIPWNPTRVIQRVGRINRIGKKVFDQLMIYNFFPSKVGANVVKSREIAAQKMFLIHNSLGEDSKIFDPEEEPSPSELFSKVNENPENEEEINIITLIRNRYAAIKSKYPEIVENASKLPARVKTAKSYNKWELNVLRKKGLGIFAQQAVYNQAKEGNILESLTIDELIKSVECDTKEPKLSLSDKFWPNYDWIKNYKPSYKLGKSEMSLEVKAQNNLKFALKFVEAHEEDLRSFINTLVKDIRHYHTLSDYTLGRIGRIKLSTSPTDKEIKRLLDAIKEIKTILGTDYLDNILKNISRQKLEVIIAVENIEG